MEELLVYALLLSENIITEKAYRGKIDKLFEKEPKNELLLELEWESNIKKAVMHTIASVEEQGFNEDVFGKLLMEKLKDHYKRAEDIKAFTEEMYRLWRNIPDSIKHYEPFVELSCLGDPLWWGDEALVHDICNDTFNYYIERHNQDNTSIFMKNFLSRKNK